MNRFKQIPPSKQDAPIAQLLRKDFISAQLVEIGIVIQIIQGTHDAAEYMKSKRVDLDVALRVLTYPQKRRTWREWSYAPSNTSHPAA